MSTLNVSNISDGTTTVGTSYVVNGSAKAWVNVIYTSSLPSSIGSLNISSVSDNTTGNYDANFTSNFNDNNNRVISGTGCSGTGGNNSITVSHADINNTGNQGIKVAEDTAVAIDQKNTVLFGGDLA
jgi:hypothetical protein